ncbi:hypothetical protein CRUP_013214 [Coryphaenoides rupestris]|nr:hypothetical protein CRUP_013214 [Coryphaenoides rupestris]
MHKAAQQQELYAQNVRRESWCQVERSGGRCCWERPQRRHFGRHLRAASGDLVDRAAAAAEPERRSAWMDKPAATAAALPERRHFQERSQTHLT